MLHLPQWSHPKVYQTDKNSKQTELLLPTAPTYINRNSLNLSDKWKNNLDSVTVGVQNWPFLFLSFFFGGGHKYLTVKLYRTYKVVLPIPKLKGSILNYI